MIKKELLERPQHVFPAESWRLVEREFSAKYLASMETLFTVANGYIGIRGSFEDGAATVRPGTFVNGFYESWPITYGENAFGFARTGQTIVPVPDASVIKLYVDDEPFTISNANLLNYERALDMKSGTLDREILWETVAGKKILIKTQRMVSFAYKHLAAMCYEVTVLNADAPVLLSSKLENYHPSAEETNDPRKKKGFEGQVLFPKVGVDRKNGLAFGYATPNSKMTLGCGIDHVLMTRCPHKKEVKKGDDSGKIVYTIDAKAKSTIRLIKYISYHTSRSAPPEQLCDRVNRTLNRAVRDGYPALKRSQQKAMDEFWKYSDVEVKGDELIQQTIRFNIFHMGQATVRAEGVGVPAKGLTGDGYEGHYFWDTEIYIVPFLIYTAPRIARNVIEFRHSYLEKARKRAKEVNQKGALFPWRTINGEEASAYYAAGTAQYHINADIVYAMRKYVEVTGDEAFLERVGGEILVETARLWCDLGFFSERKGGAFCIHGVTGPDEYNTVVNNNTYTNLMARENLWYAARTIRRFQSKKPKLFKRLTHKTSLDPAEIDHWQEAADRMYVPFDEAAGIHPQDDEFLDRKQWDFENVPESKYPLLLHFHPLVIYRHQVIKQADIVMAMFLLGNEFSKAQKKKNFEYYDPLTTGDSSLSACIQSILAFEIGDRAKAIDYAQRAALVDLEDLAGNVKDGCHIASMGGFWMALIYGFAGMHDYGGRLSFEPKMGTLISGLRFSVRVRGQVLEIRMDFKKENVTYRLREGAQLTLFHHNEKIDLSGRKSVTVPIQPAKISRKQVGVKKRRKRVSR